MFDTLVTAAVGDELQKNIKGARVQKIIQPSSTETVINFYHSREVKRLLFSVHPSLSRVHLTSRQYRQESTPPNFCMLLRKYLEGGVLEDILQPSWERALIFTVSKGAHHYRLVAEIMGRHSNLILLDDQDKILGAIKHVTPEMSRYRTVFPGKTYFPPPTPRKFFPDQVGGDTFIQKIIALRQKNIPWEKALVSLLHGLSPVTAKELVYRAGEHAQPQKEEFAGALWREVRNLAHIYRERLFSPALYATKEGKTVCSAMELRSSGHRLQSPCRTVNELLDQYYSARQTRELTGQKRESLAGLLQRELKRVYLKKKRQEEEWGEAQNADTFRLYGELILSHMDRVPRNASRVRLPNLYHARQEPVEIPLDPRLPAPANAQRYFKKYRRAQKSKAQIKIQLERTQREARYLESVLYSLDGAGMEELEDIRQELIQTGYLSPPHRKKERKPPPASGSEPLSFTSSEGYRILVGRNNIQNDRLTFHQTGREDTWLHAQKIPGSHVIIKGAPFPPPENTLLDAASLAAYFSKNRELSRVTVDYTQVKHVKRAPGGKPGMVFYKNFSSITVSPRSKTAGNQ